MKRTICLLLAVLCAAAPLSGCGKKAKAPAATNTPIESSAPAETGKPQEETTAAPKPQNDAVPTAAADADADTAAVRKEIAKMIQDANDLIEEGLTDDAKMALRDLRSRDLTDEEKEQVNALQAKLLSISD